MPLQHRLRPVLIAGALLVPIGCGTDGPAPRAEAVDDEPTEIRSTALLDAVDRTVLDQLIEYPDTGGAQVTAAIIEIPPGAETGPHFHEVPLFAYILEGTLTVTYDVDGEEVVKTFTEGDAILEAIGTHHEGSNDGDTTVRLVAVYIGAEGASNVVPL